MRRRVFLVLLACILSAPLLTAVVLSLWVKEQNRAGREEWDIALARVQAAGEPTDYESLIPPAIPDADNLAAIDLFKLERDADTKNLETLKLNTALNRFFGKVATENFGSFIKGQSVDSDKLRHFIAERYRAALQKEPAGSTLAQIDELCPELVTVREAAVTCHDCRFDRDYSSEPPYARDIGNPSSLIRLTKALNFHGVTALHENRPDIAFRDFHAVLTIVAGLRKEPTLVSGLVALADFTIAEQILWEGIATDRWTDAQLAQLQAELSRTDFLSDGQICLRAGAIGSTIPMLDFMQRRQGSNSATIRDLSKDPLNMDSAGQTLLWRISPTGWYDSAKAKTLTLLYDAARALDPAAHQFHPQAIAAIPDFRKTFAGYRPPVMLAGIAMGPITSGAQYFAIAQFRNDAALIAIMIERYRLAHGALPASLNDLTAFGPVPRDLCADESYHYSVRPDKTYLLYSVGWNQTDDHGEVIYDKEKPTLADFKKGDWVWPQPGHPGS